MYTMIFASAVLLLSAVGALGAPDPTLLGKRLDNSRTRPSLDIVNGNKTSISKYPYMASMHINGNEYASAVILNKDWFLTTSFAVSDISPDMLVFRVGSTDYDKGGQTVKASKIVSHPKYDPSKYDYNIALVKTDKPIKFGKNVKPISALGSKDLEPGTKAFVAGWGVDANWYLTESLTEAEVTLISQKECKESYVSLLTSRMFCSHDENFDPCNNDWGDPLVVDNVLYGLFIENYDCTPGKYPIIYTDVTKYTKWIQSSIKGEE